jgi:hypothetical protein
MVPEPRHPDWGERYGVSRGPKQLVLQVSHYRYNSGMKYTVQAGTRIATWMLCVVLALLSASSPHCDLCDGPHATVLSSSSQPALNHPAPTEPDTCNGVCSCCGFHWLPDTGQLLTSVPVVSAITPAEVTPPLPAFRSSPYRPPRAAVSL